MFLPQLHFSPILIWPYMEQPKQLCFLLLKRYGPKIGNGGLKILALCSGSTETPFFDIVGASEASIGIRETPQAVVKNALRAFEEGGSHIISGRQNYWVAQVSRFFSRQSTLGIVERALRPQNGL